MRPLRPGSVSSEAAIPHFLVGDGEAATLIRSIDWAGSALGPPSTWPSALKTTLGIMLHSRHPMFLWWGPDLIQFYNDAYIPSFGKGKHPTAMGQRGEDCWPEIWAIISPQIRDVMDRGIASWNEDQLVPIFRNGAIQDVYWTYGYSPVFDEEGAITATLVVCQETTSKVIERHRLDAAHREVQASRQRLFNLFDSAPAFVCALTGPEHIIELANPLYEQLVGPDRDVVGKPLAQALPEIVEQGFIAVLDRVVQDAVPHRGLETKVQLAREADGGIGERYVTFVYQPRRGAEGSVEGVDVFGFDVTEAVQSRLDAQRARDVSRALSESIPQHVWTAASSGEIRSVNHRMTEYFGLSESLLLGDSWKHCVHLEDLPRFADQWAESLRTGADFEIECRLKRHDRALRWHLMRALPLRGEDGQIAQWFGTSTDIDEAKRVREELRQRSEIERHILGIVSHDLRTPLHVISLGASYLSDALAQSRDGMQVVQRIQSAARRGVRMLEDLMDFTQVRLGGGLSIDPQPADLHAIANAAQQELSLVHPQRTILVQHEGLGQGTWDHDRVAQLLVNLLSNALQYGTPTEPVTLRTGGTDTTVWMRVHNAGAPIPEQARDSLFEPMQRATRKNSGRSIGLGLFIVAEIAKRHGGSVDVVSGADIGTTFTVRLPRNASLRQRSTGDS